jgi:hypothetical protein
MPVMIPVLEIKNVNTLGEVLRSYCFMRDEHGGDYGCYSTFALRPDFVKVTPESERGQALLKTFCKTYGSPEEIREELGAEPNLWSNGEIDLAWHWDGDGTLLFTVDGVSVINHDCKKDHDWAFVVPEGIEPFHAWSDQAGRLEIPADRFENVNRLFSALQSLGAAKKFSLGAYSASFAEVILQEQMTGRLDAIQAARHARDIAEYADGFIRRYSKARDAAYFKRAVEILKPLIAESTGAATAA